LGQLPGGVPGIAKMSGDDRLMVRCAYFPAEGERPQVAGDGFAEVAQLVLKVAQAVPDHTLSFLLTELSAER
jgi:hypothetical protein